jgi:hypothetical protein
VRERGGYPANFSQIKETILKLADLKISQSDPIGPSQFAHMELDQPGKGAGSGTQLELANAQGKVLQSLLLGKKHMEESRNPSPYGGGSYPDGRYVMLGGDTQNVLLISDALSSIEPGAEPWLSRDFFKIEKPESISFQSPTATNSWKLTRESETAPWVLSDTNAGETLDSNKVSSVASTLGYPSFVDVASNTAPAQTGLDKALLVSINTFDHFHYDLKIGDKNPENNFHFSLAVTADFPTTRAPGKDEKPEEKTKLDKEFTDNLKTKQDKLAQEKALAPWVYLVNASLLDPLIRDRSQLLVDTKVAKPEEPAAPPSEPVPSLSLPAEPPK